MNLRRSLLFILIASLLTSNASFAESACVRIGNNYITLTDYANCRAGLIQSSNDAGWKFAIRENSGGEIDVGCWRSNDYSDLVEINGESMTVPIFGVVDAKFCLPPEPVAKGRLWDAKIEHCENFDFPDATVKVICEEALKLAESFGESDPRFVRTLDALSVRLEETDNTKREEMIRRSLGIYRDHFSTNYVAQVATMAALARTRAKQGDLQGGIAIYDEAIALGVKHLGTNDLTVIAEMLLFGKFYLDHGKPAEAITPLTKALTFATKSNTSFWVIANSLAASSARLLSQAYRAEGNITEAELHMELYRKMKQSPIIRETGPKDIDRWDTEES
jgi:tetratricopeptide (TPR) repeat protein